MALEYEPNTLISYLVVALDFAKGVSWPLVAFLALIIFKREIGHLALRVKQVGPSGIHIGQLEQDTLSVVSEVSSKKVGVLPPLRDEIVEKYERAIKEKYDEIQSDHKIDYLFRDFAEQAARTNFAIAYSSIFGSQIRLLKDLNVRPLALNEVNGFFESVKPNNSYFLYWNLSHYLTFLFNFSFIKFENDYYSITETGRNFLHFLTEYKLSENRPYY